MADLTDDVVLTKQLCALLGQIPGWEYRESGAAYSASDVGIFYGAIADAPDRAVGVRVYGATDPAVELGWRRVQLRMRGARQSSAGADELASAAFAHINDLSRVGGISGIRRESMAPLGADQNGREERSDNYIIILDNPEADPS